MIYINRAYFVRALRISRGLIKKVLIEFLIDICLDLRITGHTDDYHMMLQSLMEKHPNTKIICIGFSLGGNLVTKYLGERRSNKLSNIIGGISICQGYNAIE